MFISSPKTGTATFPDAFSTISNFSYQNGLILLRLKDAPVTRRGEDADYIVGADFSVTFDVDGKPTTVTVPEGMVTDLTSVPRLFRWLVGRVGPHLEAAIVHDYLYVAWQLNGRGVRMPDRRFADEVMLAAMKASKVGAIFRTVIYLSVRLFGKMAYRDENRDLFVDIAAPQIAEQFPDKMALCKP